MNPLPIIMATMRRHWLTFGLFALLIAVAVAVGVLLSLQERGFRKSSARAADKFDILIAAPGSQTDVVLSAIYLRPTAVPLLDEAVFAKALATPHASLVAPLGFGDSYQGETIIGTIAPFVAHLSAGLSDGRLFATELEAVIGSRSVLSVGATFKPSHGIHAHGGHVHAQPDDDDDEVHDVTITVVGRMKPTGTPWDTAIVVPIEQVWRTHSLPNGHAPGGQHIGLPFDPPYLSGVPVIVMKPDSVAAAYGLRAAFRIPNSMAFFPAEVLVQLYGLLSKVQSVLGAMAIASQALVLIALMGAAFALVSLSKRQFAILRILGAPQPYIMLCVWGCIAAIVILGSLAGLALAAAVSTGLSGWLQSITGLVVAPVPEGPEFKLMSIFVALGLGFALVPAYLVARQKPLDGLT